MHSQVRHEDARPQGHMIAISPPTYAMILQTFPQSEPDMSSKYSGLTPGMPGSGRMIKR